MSKRTLEDVEDVEVNDNSALSHKKSKKDKKEKKEKKPAAAAALPTPVDTETASTPVTTDGEVVETKKDKKSKKEKKEKKRKAAAEAEDAEATPAAAVEAEDDAMVVDSEEPKKKSKKDKKEKKDKKRKAAETTEAETANAGEDSAAAPASTKYEQSAALSAVPQSEIDAFLSKQEIVITDPLSPNSNTLRPITEFSHLPKTALVAKNPFKAFKSPTPIQAASWPFGLSGRDIVGVAETGSGKTLGFGVPLINAVLGMPKQERPGFNSRIRAVVVSPTRELAMQTSEQLTTLGALVGLKTVCIYGGASKDDQRTQLRRADIIVATPGRLKDFIEEGTAKLEGAQFVVLDEADRMLDKGFEDDIKRILSCAPTKENRQTLMYTATWPQSVQALASTFMVSPVKIQIGGNASGDLQANSRIEQRVEVVDPRGKEQRLLALLKAEPRNERVLVFCLYKKEATRVEQFLQQRGLSVGGIHGDLRQEQRTRSLEAFKTGQTPVLVATDVAARGLDIPEVKLVINCTFPLTIEDYVHRIGRTGRAGKTGRAITLFTEHDKSHSGELINILKSAGQPVPDELLKFGTTVKKKAHGTYGAFFKDVDMSKKGTKITFD
ncbi:P-loop containing nucleoside triphosphate hydrolase protein [Microdochium bolleyi]|uniref:RNA helicase n=1 Tax=Microdochium bolleyi TaxID=196109 RepID=A0A136JD44_9PEZI|nr:P-loop containing nucleoside triphosphate hydrolase protein [Microdochium bolleyi]